jgi:hypothetical protein
VNPLSRWREARAYAGISTRQLEKFRDHAAAHGLDASREHYEAILASRLRRALIRCQQRAGSPVG